MHNFTQETHALYYTESLMYYITMETHKPHYTRIHSQHHTGNTREIYALHYTVNTCSTLDRKHARHYN